MGSRDVKTSAQAGAAGATTTPTTVEVQPPSERHRARSIIATVLGVLSVIMLVVAVTAVWAKATILRREPVAELVGNALDEPEVQTALAQRITDEISAALDLQTRLTAQLPDQLQRFAPAIVAGVDRAVEQAVAKALDSDQLHDVIVELVGRAHDAAMHLLEGGGLGHGISIEDGTITFNTLPLMGRAFAVIQSMGLLGSVTPPELSPDGDPDQQIADLSATLGRQLPADFGQIVVYQSDSLANAQANLRSAQDMLVLAERAVWLVVLLWVVLVAAAILVAARRWRATLVLGLGTVAGMVLLRSAMRGIVDKAPSVAAKPGAKAAIRVILGGASESLLRLAGIMLLIGLVAAAVAVMRRRRWRADLVLVAAVAAGVAVVGFAGLSIWSLLVGIVVGIAVPFVARWVLPPQPPPVSPAPA